jgi:hypothetical protein
VFREWRSLLVIGVLVVGLVAFLTYDAVGGWTYRLAP